MLKSKTGGLFFETNDDAIFVSRFDNDFRSLGALQTQYWNIN